MYFLNPNTHHRFERIVACLHSLTRIEEELNILVDLGVTEKM